MRQYLSRSASHGTPRNISADWPIRRYLFTRHFARRRSSSTPRAGSGRAGRVARFMPLWWILTSGSAPRWRKSKRRKCCSITSGRTFAFIIGGLTGTTYARSSRCWMWSVSSPHSSFFRSAPKSSVNVWARSTTHVPVAMS